MSVSDGVVIRSFLESLRGAKLEEYVRGILFCFGAPTIKGLKAATLINFKRGDEDVRSIWDTHAAEWLAPLGVEWILLDGDDPSSRSALVMLYRRDILERALADRRASEILTSLGYPLPDLERCLSCLRARYQLEFPHEIGLFLNYPPEDVLGFMERREAKEHIDGYWKVYGNVKKARRTSRRYRRAEREAARALMSGSKTGRMAHA
ncbi:MAG: DUF3793 family protein [Fretibacterium sp.]|nr:DUF3793 family protein [Fretibacterium sp.]